jgi:ATP-dependent RNA helicase DDX18/HAS1
MVKKLQILVLDEADRILEQGFEKEMKEIIKKLASTSERRQTILFSATNVSSSENTRELAKLAMKNDRVEISLRQPGAGAAAGRAGFASAPTVAGVRQGYIVCPQDARFLVLYTFLMKNSPKKAMSARPKKVIVFFSTCSSVEFHAALLNHVDLPVASLHGKMKQNKRTSTFFSFCHAEEGILLCTDVAARGLDIPDVDWIVQYDPPDDPKEYIHRCAAPLVPFLFSFYHYYY